MFFLPGFSISFWLCFLCFVYFYLVALNYKASKSHRTKSPSSVKRSDYVPHWNTFWAKKKKHIQREKEQETKNRIRVWNTIVNNEPHEKRKEIREMHEKCKVNSKNATWCAIQTRLHCVLALRLANGHVNQTNEIQRAKNYNNNDDDDTLNEWASEWVSE